MLEIRRATVLMRVAIKRVLSAACEQVNGENVHGDERERERERVVFWPPFEIRLTLQIIDNLSTSKISMKMQKNIENE